MGLHGAVEIWQDWSLRNVGSRTGVGRMWIVIAGMIALLTLLWVLPAYLTVHLRQNGYQTTLKVRLRLPIGQVTRDIDVTHNATKVIEHLYRRWQEKGEPVKEPLQRTIHRFPTETAKEVVGRPLLHLGRRTTCRKLRVAAELGGMDAMQSALLVGGAWSAVGILLGQLSRLITIDPLTPHVEIRPNFSAPAWRIDAECILKFKLGEAIVTVIWMVQRTLKAHDVVAWVRDSVRRKGDE
jgi:hypothetical protein